MLTGYFAVLDQSAEDLRAAGGPRDTDHGLLVCGQALVSYQLLPPNPFTETVLAILPP